MKITKILIVACWVLTASLFVMAVICFEHKDWTKAICNVLWMFVSFIQTRNIYKLDKREEIEETLNKMIDKADKAIENLEARNETKSIRK